VAREVGVALHGAGLHREAGFARKATRKAVFTAGLKPHSKENPRTRPKPTRGRQRFFDAALDNRRFTVERPFAWEDNFTRLLLRFETPQSHHLGFKLLAFTLINLREFCGG
jgi:transposase